MTKTLTKQNQITPADRQRFTPGSVGPDDTLEKQAKHDTIQIHEETLSDDSKVYNVELDEVIYCRNQIAAINLISEIREAIERAR